MKLSAWAWAIPVVGLAAAASLGLAGKADAARLENPVAEFAGIDKITGRITTFDVYVNETVQFGALQVTPKVCYSRDETEAQKIDAFIEVDEITLDRKIRRIFSGWMFADSPALNAVEHPIYDVWLTGCKVKSDVPAPPGVEAAAKLAPEPAKPDATPAAATTAPPADPNAAPAVDPNTVPATDPNAAPQAGTAPPGTVPPLDAPQQVPNETFGGSLPPPTDYPVDGDPALQGQPQPVTPPPTPLGGVGLY
ncbi:hypothetical protein DFO46_1935 [Rhizobium sp. AG855]|nr:hypothetical protein DFO46_1935 [Rhizobium sp. AG855]